MKEQDYTDVCPLCDFFDKRDGTCDMCAWGHPTAIDNNGLTPDKVKGCDYKRGETNETGTANNKTKNL